MAGLEQSFALREGLVLVLVLLGTVLSSIVFYVYPLLRISITTRKVPLMGKEIGNYYRRRNEFLKDPMRFYVEGHNKHKDKPFRVTHYEGMYGPLSYLVGVQH